ncbi:Phospho-N-acetylmuramoyl-pentapeptide-transferase [Candidatus Ichthyocystis hellenicum]|uniref:Phospho-N-acetylmuramoyl-pentapeptide-transferase n=1 Tax=Candidatus Ichthyocystis hellenicum TaxID=1561003 RepID=A0A0S4M3C2_9BURK|nr:phospho-N-acetylmuramoyl-pentapeptide-transferase [Candidatus Ichthyocystis hellenicum]CUT17468.1 Phospho-N-acetylmuramoyl-pentapeptide-transferase [Candidatus Ichthyocystis hellenicum]
MVLLPLLPCSSSTLFIRSFASFMTSFLAALILGKPFIGFLQRHNIDQSIREFGPSSHYSKEGTPSMGGVLVIFLVTVSCSIWTKIANRFVITLLFVMWSYGGIGFWDDYRKMTGRSYHGLSAIHKYFLQSLLAVVVIVFLLCLSRSIPVDIFSYLSIPYHGFVRYPAGVVGFCVLSYFVLVGSANAVNLTDGLDGLAIFPVILSVSFFALLAALMTHVHKAELDFLSLAAGINEVLVFCTALIGSGLGFLWFNVHPARIFMGDVGSLSLGAVLGALAIIFRQEIVFFVLSLIFVSETLSVIVQVLSRRLFKKKVFLMAPFHHHFELNGCSETTIVVRFWILAMVFFVAAVFLFFNS